MDESIKETHMRRVDFRDSSQVNRSRAMYFMSLYANRTEIELNPEDIRLTFMQIQGFKDDRLQLEEQVSVNMTRGQARALRDALKRLLADYEESDHTDNS